MTGLPCHSVLVGADELAARPELLAGWVSAVRGHPSVTLVVTPGAWAPEEVAGRLPPLLDAAGIDDAPDSPAVLALTGPLSAADHRELAAGAEALYGAADHGEPYAALRRLDPEALPAFLAAADGRRAIRSFDVFDTLIARRCIDPHAVFAVVAARAGMPEFSPARVQAEARILDRRRTLEDIYEQLQEILGLSDDRREELRRLELAVELEQVVPIEENLARVRHGDLLISDMYLSAPQIRDLLGATGLTAETGLVVSNDGKSTGRIWLELAARCTIEEHLGDNEISDVTRPAAVGIAARHTDIHAPTPVESLLMQRDLRALAELARELRLRTWSEDPERRLAQMMQASFNVPMLALASVMLVRFLGERDLRRVLFSSRDCYAWVPLFEQIAGQLGYEADSEYFYTSRLTRVNPSPDYLEYARSRVTADAAVVDICGSGWSLARLAQALEQTEMNVFLVYRIPPTQVYAEIGDVPAGCRFGAVIGPERRLDNTIVWEMCNYAGHGMVVDVEMIGGHPLAVMDDDVRGARELALVDAQLEVAALAARLAPHHDLSSLAAAGDDTLREAFAALYTLASRQTAYGAMFMGNFALESDRVEAELARALASPAGPATATPAASAIRV